MLADPPQPKYGYELTKLTGLRSGTIYPVLMRLAAIGWLESNWEESTAPNRPPRHAYRLTTEGCRGARELLSTVVAVPLKPRLAE